MEVKDKNEIRKEIKSFAKMNGGSYSDYYIGITRNLERRIYEDVINEHIRNGLYDPDTPLYVARAKSRDIAFSIEKEFQYGGMKRYNPGGKGKEDSEYIYCFRIKTALNDNKLPIESNSIHLMVEGGRERVRLRWFESFRRFFNLK